MREQALQVELTQQWLKGPQSQCVKLGQAGCELKWEMPHNDIQYLERLKVPQQAGTV